jgi:hypothetical protein
MLPAERLCAGMGTGAAPSTTSCGLYACNAAMTACRTTCAGDADCAASAYCNGSTCTAKKNKGAGCAGDNQCISGFCVDGVCCDAACVGSCRACTMNKTGVANGTCSPIQAGMDPDNECATTAASTCGTDGACDGMGACRFHAAGTECVAQSCTGVTQTNADTCNGSGTCVDNGTTNCTPYACGGTSCRTSCGMAKPGDDANCAPAYYCDGVGGGACQPKKLTGAACGRGAECLSGVCVDFCI